jgi:hypothetical protein
MTDLQHPSLAAQPVISYPREAQVGKTYLMTVDLRLPADSGEWAYDDEEYPIYCMLDTAPLFSSKPIGEPAILLHRFGGTYGPARFLLTAGQRPSQGTIRVTLVNGWGMPMRVLKLANIRVIEAPVPAEESDLRVQREAMRRAVAPARVSSQVISTGLLALTELMQLPEVRSAAAVYQSEFQAVAHQIALLATYKDMHDLLHQLQFQCYNIMVQDAKRFPEDTLARESLEECEMTLQRLISNLRYTAAQASPERGVETWIDELVQARDDLRTANETLDMSPLKRAIGRLRRVLSLRPAQINAYINDAAHSIRLSTLVRAIINMRDRVIASEVYGESARQFDGVVDALDIVVDALNTLDDQLTALVSEHNRWQSTDTDLLRIEDFLNYDLSELELSWPDLKISANEILADNTAEWALALRTAGEQLESAIAAQDQTRIRQFFQRYRSQAGQRFFQVDRKLVALIGELRMINGQLASVLRVSE